MIGNALETLASMSSPYVFLMAVVVSAGLCLAIWVLLALRTGLGQFVQSAVIVCVPFGAVYTGLGTYKWNLDMRIMEGIWAAWAGAQLATGTRGFRRSASEPGLDGNVH